MSSFIDESAEAGDSDEGTEASIPETPDITGFLTDGDGEEEDEDDDSSKESLVKSRRKVQPAVLDSTEDEASVADASCRSDNEEEEEDDIPIRGRARKVFNIPSSDEEEDIEKTKRNATDRSQKEEEEEAEKTMEEMEDEIERKIEKYRFSPKTRRSMGVFRQAIDSESESDEELSNEINEKDFNIADGFSSTMMVPRGSDLLSVSTDRSADEDSLILLEAKVPTIDLLDDSPENVIPATPPVIKTEPNKQSQPKITEFAKVQVPREVFEEQKQRLEQMQQQVSHQENLYKTVGRTMFDGGEKLLSRINSLRKDVEEQRRSVERLQVAPDAIVDLSVDDGPQSFNKENRSLDMNQGSFGAKNGSGSAAKSVDWNELENMLKKEQPRYVGKQGIKTFENQKAVTMETLKDIHGSLSTRPPETAMVDTPKSLKVELMDHQKNALAFMNWRESQRPRGGLLADDMGLGKTLTMLSLVASDLEKMKENKEGVEEEEEESDEDEEGDDNDAENSKGKADKAAPKKKGMTGWSAKGRRDQYEGGTLVVCPASLLQQWEGEVKTKMHRNSLNYLVYHGTKRDSRGRYLSEYDLVITTYSIASVDKKSNIGLYRVKWRRIILDEGHAIRNHKSQMSLAACELVGKRRWLLTGTPIHNKEMDMYAVLKFIKCQPFNDMMYFKKWIDNKTTSGKERLNTLLKSVMLRRTKAELQQKGALQSLPTKNITVIQVRMDKDEMNIYQRVLFYSRTLFAQFLDQRAEKVADGMMRQNDPTKDPNSVYFKLHKKMAKMAKPRQAQQQVQQYQILVLLLRLRQICCHPGLINAMLEDLELASGGGAFDESSTGDEDQSDIDLLNQLEKMAIDEGVAIDDSGEAPAEEGDGGTQRKERIMVPSNPVFDFARPSSKMKMILEKIEELLQGDDKIVIVSQWTSVLNVLEGYTKRRQIHTTKLTGEVQVKDRGQVVDKFNEKAGGPRIMFLSLSAGGVGLNLVAANHLFLVDLHWNPQLEQQAQDRIYRFGQQKPVTIYKFVTTDSIEQRIQALQDHKLSIADAVLTGSKGATGAKLTIADLKMLFDM